MGAVLARNSKMRRVLHDDETASVLEGLKIKTVEDLIKCPIGVLVSQPISKEGWRCIMRVLSCSTDLVDKTI